MAEQDDTRHDRRRFMRLVGAGGLAGLAGCMGGGDDGDSYGGGQTADTTTTTTASGDGDDTETTTEDQGSEDLGEVVYTINAGLTKFDPSTNFDVTSLALSNVYEPLVWHNLEGNQQIHPGLAKSYEVSEDGTTWTFSLREGVQFHGGGELTAEDVVFSLDRTRELGQGPAFIWGPVDSVAAEGDYTVRFDLSSKAPLDLIASSQYGAWIFSKELTQQHGDGPESQKEWFMQANETGTGPYTIESWERSANLTLSKFDDYWGGWEGPHYSTARLKTVKEASTNIQLLTNGDVQIIRNAPYPQLSELESNPDVEITRDTSFTQLYGLINVQKEPTDDVHVRKAIRHAFPYEDAVETILAGYGETIGTVIPRNMWGHNADLEVPEFDLDLAASELEQSSYDPAEMQLTFNFSSGHDTWRRALLFLQENLKQIGVGDVAVESYPSGTYFERSRNPDTAPNMTLFWWWPTYVTPYDYLYSMFHSVAETDPSPIFNLTYWRNQEFDDLINEARTVSATDRETAIGMFEEAQVMVEENALAVNFWQLETVRPHLKRLQGYDPNPSYTDVVFFYDLYE